MDRETVIFGDIETEKHKFYRYKIPGFFISRKIPPTVMFITFRDFLMVKEIFLSTQFTKRDY